LLPAHDHSLQAIHNADLLRPGTCISFPSTQVLGLYSSVSPAPPAYGDNAPLRRSFVSWWHKRCDAVFEALTEPSMHPSMGHRVGKHFRVALRVFLSRVSILELASKRLYFSPKPHPQSSASGSSSPYISSSRSSLLLRLFALPSAALTSSSIFCVKKALISLCRSALFDRRVLRYAVFSVTLVADGDGKV
jgi:hypothetical protein